MMPTTHKNKRRTPKASTSLSSLELKMLQWLDSVQQECARLLDSETSDGEHNTFDFAAFGAWRIRTTLCLNELLGAEHVYCTAFYRLVEDEFSGDYYKCAQASHFLSAIRQDMEAGYLRGYRGLIQAELFSDFLDRAEHLHEQGYKDPAAVIAGSVLEDHLKKLCLKHNVPMNVQKQNGDLRPLTASEITES